MSFTKKWFCVANKQENRKKHNNQKKRENKKSPTNNSKPMFVPCFLLFHCVMFFFVLVWINRCNTCFLKICNFVENLEKIQTTCHSTCLPRGAGWAFETSSPANQQNDHDHNSEDVKKTNDWSSLCNVHMSSSRTIAEDTWLRLHNVLFCTWCLVSCPRFLLFQSTDSKTATWFCRCFAVFERDVLNRKAQDLFCPSRKVFRLSCS